MRKKVTIIALITIFLVGAIAFYYSSHSKRAKNLPTASLSQNSNNDSAPKDFPRLSVITENLNVPWDIAFLPDNSMLITQRTGEVVKLLSNGTKIQLIDIEVSQVGESGLHGISIHPDYESNKLVYVYYTFADSGGNNLNRVSRFTHIDNSLIDEEVIIDNIPGARFHDGGRLRFGPDNLLYVTTGDATDPSLSQNTTSLAGKVLRVTPEGDSPPDNPFSNQVYSLGHRNPQGITWDQEGNLWLSEHGPTANDEINNITIGANYGWPSLTGNQTGTGFVTPVIHSGNNTWAPAGLDIINDSIFFAGLRGSALYEYNIKTKELSTHLKDELGRIRAVTKGSDKMLYISTSNQDGRGIPSNNDDKIIRVNPSKL